MELQKREMVLYVSQFKKNKNFFLGPFFDSKHLDVFR